MREQKVGCWFQLGSVSIFRIFQNYNFDFFVIDLEHGSHENIEQFPNFKKDNSELFARVSSRDYKYYSWLLDLGYDGIILSDVRSLDDVEGLIRGTYFSPIGSRGVGFCARNLYGMDIDEYLQSPFIPKLGLQIESIEGIEFLESSIGHYDGLIEFVMLGPYDLSCSVKKPGIFQSKEYRDAVTRFNKAVSKFGLQKGTHVIKTSLDDLNIAKSESFDYIAFSTDGKFLIDSLNKLNL